MQIKSINLNNIKSSRHGKVIAPDVLENAIINAKKKLTTTNMKGFFGRRNVIATPAFEILDIDIDKSGCALCDINVLSNKEGNALKQVIGTDTVNLSPIGIVKGTSVYELIGFDFIFKDTL